MACVWNGRVPYFTSGEEKPMDYKKLNEHLGSLASENNAREVLSEAKEPHVGIFYDIYGTIHWCGTPLRIAAGSGYYKIEKTTHPQLWEELKKGDSRISQFDSHHFPRGRVSFDTSNKQFEIAADEHILNDPDLKDQICSKFDIKSYPKVWVKDAHYMCTECQKKNGLKISGLQSNKPQ